MNLRLGKLLRSEAAASTTEYAVIVTLIAAALLLASDAVRLAADSSFRRATVALGVAPAAAPPAPASGPATAGGQLPALSLAPLPPLHALAWGSLLLAAALVGHNRYRCARRRRALREFDCPVESVAESAAEEPANPNFAKRQDIQRVLLRHFDGAVHSRIEVRHVMSRKVRAVAPTTSLADLQALLVSEGFHHVLVMQQTALLGVVSDRDVHTRQGRRVADVMTANPLCVAPTTHISQAITLMLRRRISCLPVVEAGQVKGILTTTDMLLSLQCLMQLLERSHAGNEADDAPAARSSASVALALEFETCL